MLALVVTLPKERVELLSQVRALMEQACCNWTDESTNIFLMLFSNSKVAIDQEFKRLKPFMDKAGLHMCVVSCDNIIFKE